MKICKVNGCDNPSRSNEMCTKHYARFLRHGDPEYVNPKKTYGTPIERFLTKVKKSTDNNCHIWMGAKNSDGYGLFRSEFNLAHRFIYFYHNPGQDTSLCVCHICDNPSCVNIKHLFLGTHQENMNDRDEKGRCPKGELSGAAKLTERQVIAIREDDRTTREIAKDYGVANSMISAIKRKSSWRHLNATA